jgi:glycosyltransferase involved in cell wall biosynthesis
MDQNVLSLVIPCYNEQESIPVFYREACAVLEKLEQKNIGAEFIFIDDGSNDTTANAIINLGKHDQRIHYVIFSRNFGKEAALLAGIQLFTTGIVGAYLAKTYTEVKQRPHYLVREEK